MASRRDCPRPPLPAPPAGCAVGRRRERVAQPRVQRRGLGIEEQGEGGEFALSLTGELDIDTAARLQKTVARLCAEGSAVRRRIARRPSQPLITSRAS